jgi:hypothetical protein
MQRRGSFFEADDSLFVVVEFCLNAFETKDNFLETATHLASEIIESRPDVIESAIQVVEAFVL